MLSPLAYGGTKGVSIASDSTGPSWLWSVAYHPSKHGLATGGTEGVLRLYDGDEPTDSLLLGGTITELDWHPGGRLLAIATQGENALTSIYDTESGVRTSLEVLDEFGVRAIGWNAAGDRLATGDYNGNLSIYDTSGVLVVHHQTGQKAIIGLDWSPDGRTIAAVGDDLVLVDVATGGYRTIPDREEAVLMLSVAFHPSGEFLVTGDYGDYDHDHPPLLQFWDTTGKRIRSVTKGPGEYRSLEWSHDGNRLAAVSDALRLYDREGTETEKREVAGGGLLWGVSWSPDDRTIAVTDDVGNSYRLPARSLDAERLSDSLTVLVEDLLGPATAADYAGTAIVAVKDGGTLFSRNYGLANLEHGVPVTDRTVFHLASVSKQFTGLAIARLVAAGRIALTDPVGKYLTDFPDFDHRVTIEDLLYHRSGLREWSSTLYLAGRATDDSFTNADVRRMVARQRALNFLPGSQFVYTNTNYTLLAEIVAEVTGTSFKDYLEQNVFAPLGMDHSHVREEVEEIIPNRAGSYSYRDGEAYDAVDNLAVSGASGIYSSTADLAKWGAYLLDLPRTDSAVYTLLRRRASLRSGAVIPYAFGFWPATFYGADWIDHTGSWAGSRAYSTYFPDHGLAIFVLKNYDERNYIGQHLAAAILEEVLDFSTPVTDDEPQRDTLAIHRQLGEELSGVYKLGPTFLRLQLRGGHLYGSVFPASYGDTSFSQPVRVRLYSDSTYVVDDRGVSFRRGPSPRTLRVADSTYWAQAEWEDRYAVDYTGQYYSEELNTGYDVRRTERGPLQISNLNNGSFLLRPLAKDEFDVAAAFMDFVSFKRNEQGEVTHLHISTERSVGQLFRKISNR